MSMTDRMKIDLWEKQRQGFARREEERETVRATVEPLLPALSNAETQLASLDVMTAGDRYHIGRARLELLRLLRSIEQAANSTTENNFRISESFLNKDPL